MMNEAEYSKRLIKIWIFGFVGLLVLIGSVNAVRLLKLYRAGVPVEVTVNSLEAGNHDAVHYSYAVDAVGYEGEGHGGYGNPLFPQIKTGQKLKGYYEEGAPAVSCLGEPGPQFFREMGFAFLVAAIVPTLLVLRAKSRYKKWLHDQQTVKA